MEQIEPGRLESNNAAVGFDPSRDDCFTAREPGHLALTAARIAGLAWTPAPLLGLLLGVLLLGLQHVFQHYRSPQTLPSKSHTDVLSFDQQLAPTVSVNIIQSLRADARRERRRKKSADAQVCERSIVRRGSLHYQQQRATILVDVVD